MPWRGGGVEVETTFVESELELFSSIFVFMAALWKDECAAF